MSDDDPYVEFLLRAAAEFTDGGWIFTGFNLPVLAARLARRLGSEFVQVLEAGAAIDRDTDQLLTSTTDYFETDPVTVWRGSTLDVMNSIVPRCRRVVMDAANVDVRGRTNSTVIGEWARPKVRLPGGGGGPDAAYRARHLLLLHGGSNWERIVAQVRPVTAAPAPDAVVRLITRWGTVTLGAQPRLDVLVERDDNAGFLDHLHTIGVAAEGYTSAPEWSAEDRKQAVEVLAEAASSGYAVGAAERAGQQRSDRA